MRVFFGVERQIVGVQGTMCNRIASSEPQWVVAKSEVNDELIKTFIMFPCVDLIKDFLSVFFSIKAVAPNGTSLVSDGALP